MTSHSLRRLRSAPESFCSGGASRCRTVMTAAAPNGSIGAMRATQSKQPRRADDRERAIERSADDTRKPYLPRALAKDQCIWDTTGRSLHEEQLRRGGAAALALLSSCGVSLREVLALANGAR